MSPSLARIPPFSPRLKAKMLFQRLGQSKFCRHQFVVIRRLKTPRFQETLYHSSFLLITRQRSAQGPEQRFRVASTWVVLKQLPKPPFCATFSLVLTYNVHCAPISLNSVNATY